MKNTNAINYDKIYIIAVFMVSLNRAIIFDQEHKIEMKSTQHEC